MPLGAVPFPFGICRICKDKATGLHYGVATCEGCKGFFKRSIPKHETFKCYFGGSCDINPKTRSQCKACRFKRCMETGMSIDGVRMGRIPKVEKDKVLEAFHDGGSHYSNHELVVQQTDGGNYIFDLNKTVSTSKTTSTVSDELPSLSSKPISVSTDSDNSNVTRTETENGFLVGNTNKNEKIVEELKEQPVNSLSSQTTDKDAITDNGESMPFTKPLDAPVFFKTENCNAFGDYYPGKQTSMTSFSNEIPSEKCENPFNDEYHNMGFGSNNEHQQKNPYVNQHVLKEQRMIQNTNESVTISESNMNEFKGKPIGYNTIFGNENKTLEQSDGLILPGTRQTSDDGCYKFDTRDQMEETIERLPNVREGNLTVGTISTVPTHTHSILGSQKVFDSSEDEGLRKKKSFSPTLINVLLEHVLDSQESIHVITERLHQKQQQGNLNQFVAKNLSKRITELAEAKKRQKYSEDGTCLVNPSRQMECLETVKTLDNLNPPVQSLGNVGLFENATRNTESYPLISSAGYNTCLFHQNQVDRTNFHCHQYLLHPCGKCDSSFTKPNMVQKYERKTVEQPKVAPVVTSGTVSSTSLSMEEEYKQQQITNTLDGINIAMKILNRLKAEHREKIRQFKQGKLYIRVMTDSEEDIKETYTKLINGIPNLNERILGFCNNIPGIHDITKEDQDVLMKRAYYDIWMLNYSEYIEDDVSYLIMESGEIYSKMAMKKILNDNMVDKLFEFANQFNSLNLTDLEVAIICATRLTATEGIELSDRANVAALHSHLLDVLAEEVKRNHDTGHARKLIDIFSLLPLLETVNRIQREIIAKFSV